MRESQQSAPRPELKEIVLQASRALANLDAVRLEELALSCDALNREQITADETGKVRLAQEVRRSAQDMALLASVLEATRANLRVLRQLDQLRLGKMEYAPRASQN